MCHHVLVDDGYRDLSEVGSVKGTFDTSTVTTIRSTNHLTNLNIYLIISHIYLFCYDTLQTILT